MSKKGKEKRKNKITFEQQKEFDDDKVEGDGSKPLKNPMHELFCILYAGVGTRHFFGNAQNSYVEAFGYGKEFHDLEVKLVLQQSGALRKSMSRRLQNIKLIGRVSGSRLLTSVNITNRVNHFMDQFCQNEVADRELAFTIVQREDMRSKVAAIAEYNRVKDRVKDNKLSGELVITWGGDKAEAKKKK